MTRKASLTRTHHSAAVLFTALILSCLAFPLRADQVEMLNGDRFTGKVLSLDANSVVFQSDVLGIPVKLPRKQVTQISFGATSRANATRLRPASTNQLARPFPGTAAKADPELAAILRQLSQDTNAVQAVQRQFLTDAGPAANQKFNELLSGLMNGKLTVEDLRTQARSAADQVRAYRRDLGGETAGMDNLLDSYLEILDNFLQETAPASGSVTNAPAGAKGSKGIATDQKETSKRSPLTPEK